MTKKQLYDFHQFLGKHMPVKVLHIETVACDLQLCACGMFFIKGEQYHGWCSQAMIRFHGARIRAELDKSVWKEKVKLWDKYVKHMSMLPRQPAVHHSASSLE